MPPTPAHPEPLDALRARYPRALEHEFDVAGIVAHGLIRPGECAANVFDCEDGLRLIVSRERMPDGTHVLHYSASFTTGSRMYDEMRLLTLTMSRERILEMWRRDLPRRFRELSGDARDIPFIGWSKGCIAHYAIEETGAEG